MRILIVSLPSNYLLSAESMLFVHVVGEALVIVVKDIQIFSLTNPEKKLQFMIKWVLFACNHFPFPFFQDYIILDEGHKIKNTATKTAKNLRLIPAKHHFILTGTPVQNNLRVSRYIWNSKHFGKSFQYDYCFLFLFLFVFFFATLEHRNVTKNQTEHRKTARETLT